jgi:hypothetical protein
MKELPDSLYRTAYERSWTLSSHVEKGDLPTHKKLPFLRFNSGNAFQNMEEFVAAKDLNPLRIIRQTRPKKAKNPTGYISTFNTLGILFVRHFAAFGLRDTAAAKEMADKRAKKASPRGRRIYIAKIRSDHLVPVVIKGPLKYSEAHFAKDKLRITKTNITSLDAEIPAWIPRSATPKDKSPISVDKYAGDGGELWLSIAELKTSNLAIELEGHNDEWMSCGPIKETSVQEVMPYDGDTVHSEASMSPDKEIVSLMSTTRFVWNQVAKMWESSKKRKRAATADEDNGSDTSSDETNNASATAFARQKRVPTTSNHSIN